MACSTTFHYSMELECHTTSPSFVRRSGANQRPCARTPQGRLNGFETLTERTRSKGTASTVIHISSHEPDVHRDKTALLLWIEERAEQQKPSKKHCKLSPGQSPVRIQS